jgi:serine phosphatase RsbU (regulator of sigma subunit)/anti-sigma regulatory factor (Ser/Thr protein kinase)
MHSSILKYWRELWGKGTGESAPNSPPIIQVSTQAKNIGMELHPNDPFLDYALKAQGVIEIDSLKMESNIVAELREAGVKLTVPLVSQGELIGLLNLGPRLSEQEYSQDDRQLLNSLAVQATPALRVAQLARQRQEEAQERERMEQELKVARIIQQTLLPKELPVINGYQLAVHWQPARAVGGDFYDIIQFPNGRIGIFIGDVTDKGVPAALVMASTRSVLRATAEHFISPSAVLTEANNLMHPEMPSRMFVTCLYAVLNPATGHLRYANAGYNLPFLRRGSEVIELYATGMPLGLLPDMKYEENETILSPRSCLLFHSDGLVEAHNEAGEMFGFSRLRQLVSEAPCSSDLIDYLIYHMQEFTGKGWEQEDDVTFLTLENTQPESSASEIPNTNQFIQDLKDWHTLEKFSIPSVPGNERIVMERVAQIVSPLQLPLGRVEKLKTAVSEATMNAMEHGNQYNSEIPVEVTVRVSPLSLSVQITDFGGGEEMPPTSEDPDIEAKLRGEQSPRGWGLFLIENMVDGMVVSTEDDKHTIDLILLLEGDEDAGSSI